VISQSTIIPKLIALLTNQDKDIRKESAWALANATSGGTPEQNKYPLKKKLMRLVKVQAFMFAPVFVPNFLLGNVTQKRAHEISILRCCARFFLSAVTLICATWVYGVCIRYFFWQDFHMHPPF
jgi:fatty acid desaturase